jgi:adenosylcobinamide-GDP ribazoletransferase
VTASGVLASLQSALLFLTCIPFGAPRVASERPLRALAWFPAVGLLLGALQAALAFALHGHLAPNLIAVVLVATLAALTGGLHLDGVADVFDAWSGARGDKARALAIMRDSRIGAHGALALCLLLLAKVFALSELLAQGGSVALLLYPAIARWSVVPLVVIFRPARQDGLGASFHADARWLDLALATLLMACALASLAGLGQARPVLLIAAPCTLGVALGFGALLARRFGGLTGDAYGAVIELAELAFIVLAAR